MRLSKRKLILGAIILLVLAVPLLADPCDCLKGCAEKYDSDKATCQWEPQGQAREACLGQAQRNREACETDCKAGNDCNGGAGGGGDNQDPFPGWAG